MRGEPEATACVLEKGSIRDGPVPLNYRALTMAGRDHSGRAKINQVTKHKG